MAGKGKQQTDAKSPETDSGENGGRKKAECPVSRAHFRQHAKPIVASINGQSVTLEVKFFDTGSVGFFAGERIKLDVGGVIVPFQLGINLTAIGSKQLPKE